MSKYAQPTNLHHMQNAAPDMYEALLIVQRGIARGKIKDQSLLHPTPDGGDVDIVPLSSIIDAAIAKATGEAS